MAVGFATAMTEASGGVPRYDAHATYGCLLKRPERVPINSYAPVKGRIEIKLLDVVRIPKYMPGDPTHRGTGWGFLVSLDGPSAPAGGEFVSLDFFDRVEAAQAWHDHLLSRRPANFPHWAVVRERRATQLAGNAVIWWGQGFGNVPALANAILHGCLRSR
jgi:hypothetical protein